MTAANAYVTGNNIVNAATGAAITTNYTRGVTYSILIRATTTAPSLNFQVVGNSGIVGVDNVSVKEVPASRARRWYLLPDGTDDVLSQSSTSLLAASEYAIWAAIEYDSNDGTKVFGGTAASTNNNLHFGLVGSIPTVRQFNNDLIGQTTFSDEDRVMVIGGLDASGKWLRANSDFEARDADATQLGVTNSLALFRDRYN